jgi:5-formyltetrahydrofolate cyclo-ligase
MLAKRNGLTEQEIHSKSKRIQEIFTTSSFFEESNVLGVYIAHGSEVRTRLIIEAGFRNSKTIALPRVVDSESMSFHKIDEYRMNSLFRGKFGILEPKGTESEVSKALDLLIVPGIAFDLHGYRLGHGMGYYDNFLRNKGQVSVVGLAFDIQIINTQFLPHSKYDMKVDSVVTETGFRSFALN